MKVKEAPSSKPTSDEAFQLKSDFLPLTVIKLFNYNLATIKDQLSEAIDKAPKYFAHAPVILDITENTQACSATNLAALCQALREKTIIPVGIRGLNAEEEALARDSGLALFHNSKPTEPVKQVSSTPTPKPAEPTRSKVITQPVRAGSTVYAKDCDLIIMAAVNAGAECIADGNIHVYGPLRGRALAGAHGDTQARIFCTSLEAELVSIAGHYLVRENITPPTSKGMIQIYLKDTQLQIEGI